MRARSALLLVLMLLALLPLLSFTTGQPLVATAQESTTAQLTVYSKFTVPVELQPGDVLAPHLYDWFFDGVDDYLVIGLQPGNTGTPFTVYGWSEITIAERVYYVWPKANALYSLFSVIGDWWSSEPATTYETDNRTDYTRLFLRFATRREDGTRVLYSYNLAGYVNSWVHVARRFTSARELSYWVNGVRVAVWTVPSTEATILEWNPATATRPWRYQRFVLGANMEFGGWMTLYQSYLIIHRRALTSEEIQQMHSGGVVSANALEVFIDATFFNGTHYFNLGRNPATIRHYNGVSRVPASRTWLWVIRGASTDPVVWLRFFPPGSLVVFSDGSSVVIDGPVNSVGLVESFAVDRTDIAYVLVPTTQTLSASSIVYAYTSARIELTATWLKGVSNVTVVFPNGTLTWVNGTGASTTGPVLASVRAVPDSWINITYVPLPGFTGGTAELTICTELCSSVRFNITYVPGYSLDLSVQPRTTVGTVPWYTVSTNYTGAVELHNLNAYLNLTPPVPLQPGDILAPHLYDWFFDGVDDHIIVSHSDVLNIAPGNQISIAMWAKFTGWQSGYPVGVAIDKRTEGQANYNWEFNSTVMQMRVHGGGFIRAVNVPHSLNTWSFYTMVLNGSWLGGYLNGELMASRSDVPASSGNTVNLYIGQTIWGALRVAGRIASVLIHRRPLSDTEIQTLYSDSVINASSLSLFLDATFHDGSRYVDLSGNSNHGYPYGGVQRVPAERTWLWVVRGLTSDPVVWLRFFPAGSLVVFSDGSATVVSGPVNAVGLVEEFAVGRTDIAYLLVPDPSRWSERSVLTRSTVGELGFVAWVNVSAVYPLRTATVVYDKLLISWFSTSVPNATRIDAFRTSVDVCVSLVHAYDGQPVTGGAVVIAGRQATFNGTCWTTSVPPPGSLVGSRSYTVVSSATSNLNVSFVDPSPVLTYVHDALVARVVSVDYINQTAVLELRYASDGSPVPSGRIGVLYSNTVLTAEVSSGAVVFDLALLPVNVTSAPVVYGVSDNGYVSTPYVNASLPFHRLQGEWWSTRSPDPWFTVSTAVFNGARALLIRSNTTTYTWLPVAPGYVYATGGYTLIRGSAYVVASGDVVIVLDMEPTTAFTAPGVAPGAGDAYIGVSSNLTHPLSGGYVLYVRVNSTGVYAGARLNGVVVAEELVASGALPPMVVSYVYSYDHVENTTRWCTLVVYYAGATPSYTSRCIRVPGAPPLDLHPFIASESGVVVDRFAVTAGQSILYLATGDIRLELHGPYPATAIVRYIVVDKPTVVELAYGTVRVYQGVGRGLTFKGFAGYRLNLAVGGVTVSNYLIPSNDHTLELPLGFAAFLIVDPTHSTVTIVSAGLFQEPVEIGYGAPVRPVVLPSPTTVDIRLPQASVAVVLAVATASAVGVSVFRSTRRLSASLSVAGATVSFLGVVLGASGVTPAEVALSLVASGVMAGAVALAIAASKE